jgi:hypothetical protein
MSDGAPNLALKRRPPPPLQPVSTSEQDVQAHRAPSVRDDDGKVIYMGLPPGQVRWAAQRHTCGHRFAQVPCENCRMCAAVVMCTDCEDEPYCQECDLAEHETTNSMHHRRVALKVKPASQPPSPAPDALVRDGYSKDEDYR